MSVSRRFVFLAHAFPPVGGSGSNRALAFTRYLGQYGWRPIVVTPGVEWASPRDDGLLGELPPRVAIVRTRSWEALPGGADSAGAGESPRGAGPRGAARRLAGLTALEGLKGALGHAARFPDAHRGWTPFAVSAGLRAIHDGRAELIYSTAGPYTSHLVGLILHRLTRAPWVAELRDGWLRWNQAIFPDYPRWRGPLEGRLESAVVHEAGRLLLVTESMAAAFRQQYPMLPRDHFGVVPNGFDPEQYVDLPPVVADPARFRIVHAGALYFGRSADAFLQALARLVAEQPRFAEMAELVLIGTLDQGAHAELARGLAAPELNNRVVFSGYHDHRSTLAALRSADLLLLLVNTTPGAAAAVPGKLYEYLAVGRPILAVAPPGSEAAAIVARARAGWVAPAHDVGAILAQLRAAFAVHAAGTPFAPDRAVVARYDRRELARALARTFDEVADHRTPSEHAPGTA